MRLAIVRQHLGLLAAHDFVRLVDRGTRGNGHMMMLEKNSLEIARLLREWLERPVAPGS